MSFSWPLAFALLALLPPALWGLLALVFFVGLADQRRRCRRVRCELSNRASLRGPHVGAGREHGARLRRRKVDVIDDAVDGRDVLGRS